MPRLRLLTPVAVSSLTLVSLTACGSSYDPCWIDPETMAEEIFITATTQQTGGTWEGGETVTTTDPTYDEAQAEPDPDQDNVCVYTLTKEVGVAPGPGQTQRDVVRVGRFDDYESSAFDSLVSTVDGGDNRKEYSEVHRDVTIVYTEWDGQAIVDDHLFKATFTSNTLRTGGEGQDTAPVMQYLAGTNAGSDVDGYQAWLADQVELAATEVEAAAAEADEQDYEEGYAAGMEDGEHEAQYGQPPQHYHRDLAARSESWVSGFEEGKTEGLASGGTLAGGETDDLAEWQVEEGVSGAQHGPFAQTEVGDAEISAPDNSDQGISETAPNDTEVFNEGYTIGMQVGAEDASLWGEWIPNAAAFSLHYAGSEQRTVFGEGFDEGYREGFVQGWQDAGRSPDDLPVQARP